MMSLMYTVLVRDLRDRERLCAFFRDVRVCVLGTEGNRIEVKVPQSVSPLHAKRELSGYVITWNALNPGAYAELVH
jgi:hypothetical protein